jgi:hypothetical protein
LLTEFDEGFFRATIDKFIVQGEREVVVQFRDGTEIPVDVMCKG